MSLRDNSRGAGREMGTREAAAYLGYTLSTFYTKVREIHHRKERGQLFFTAEALDKFRVAQSSEHVPVPQDAA